MRLEPTYPLPIFNRLKKEKFKLDKNKEKKVDWVNIFLIVLLFVIVILYLLF